MSFGSVLPREIARNWWYNWGNCDGAGALASCVLIRDSASTVVTPFVIVAVAIFLLHLEF